ncbi:M20 family metallopeptidase [Pseudohalocynthiibacter aestuariivivens]|nr:M20/M25/M40 family metallo-hydrolase [Pseudohalocynthiibacter aestuariivivens]QIE45301.1 M20 family metallopeptidase [Pseudohalocynthiibacter aestuariivivens]
MEVIEPLENAPNLISSFTCKDDGRHLVLNGHLDTYPCDDADRWQYDPYGGTMANGAVYGRGASDMKAGTAAIAAVHAYLYTLRRELKGKLTFTAVSDEETGGKWGAQYLLEHHDVRGDCLLNSEPGGPTTVRFGEKGSLKLRFKVRTTGCHGAYTHKSRSATKIAASVVRALPAITELPVETSDNLGPMLTGSEAEFDRIHLPGAAEVLRKYTVNVGLIRGGVKMNMLPANCDCDVDIRIPIGGTAAAALQAAEEIVAQHDDVTLEVLSTDEPSWSDPGHPMVAAVQSAAAEVLGTPIHTVTSLGATDARFWREAGVPAVTYGTTATHVAMVDEHTDIDEWINVIKVHALAAYNYLRTTA